MTFARRLLLVILFAASGYANDYVVQDPPKSPEDERASFTLPPGFEIQLVASDPEIHKPMQLAFDETGRLLVTTSTGYPLGPPKGESPSDKLLLIEIDGATGRATSIKTLLDGLDIPSGVEALPGGRIILAHAPDILLLHHKDGIVDSRDVLYTGFARDDTHELPNSFTWGVDGWLYGLQGHVNKSDVKDKRGRITQIHFGNTYRMRPDGSAIEVFAPGMSNPWGLAFDERYNLFATDCESRPLWQIVRGFAYQGFNQPKALTGYAPNITEDTHGASGFAGLVYFDAETFPEEYRHCLYLGNPILGRVHRDALEGEGFTRFADRKPDFIESSDRWFRPVDLELGPDGALYIADWYNSIISHVEVRLDHPARDKTRGRIWRVVYRETDEERGDPTRRAQIERQFAGPMAVDWSKSGRSELMAALGNSQSWIRRTASQQLAHRFVHEIERRLVHAARDKHTNAAQRAESLWLAHRLGAKLDLERPARDAYPLVRAQAAQLLGLDAAKDPSETLTLLLNDSDATVRASAILSMRDRPTSRTAEVLLHANFHDEKQDTLLAHAIDVSLAAHVMTTDTLLNTDPARLDSGARERLARALASTPSREVAAALSRLVLQRLVPRDVLAQAVENIVANGEPDAVQPLFSPERLASPAFAEDAADYATAMLSALRAKPELTPALSPLLERVGLVLVARERREAERLAAEIGTLFKSEALAPVAEKVLRDTMQDTRARRNAAIALMRLDFDRYAPMIASLLANPNDSVAARRAMAEELATRSKTQEQVNALIEVIKPAPGDVKLGVVQRLLQQKPGVTLLFDAIEAGQLSPAYLTAPLFDIFVYWAHRDPAIIARYDALVARAPSITSENEKMIAALKEKFATIARDAARGKVVFEKNCMVCHRLGGKGAMRGPNLDGVGNRGIDRLLQDVVTPSRDVDPAFRTAVITTQDGAIASGLLVRETPTQFVLADAEGNETVFPRAEVQEFRREWISPMPAGFTEALGEDNLLNILSYLIDASTR